MAEEKQEAPVGQTTDPRSRYPTESQVHPQGRTIGPPRRQPRPENERKVVGRFKVLHGVHSEQDMMFDANDPSANIVDSLYDLRRLNAPGAQKFQLIGEVDEGAIIHNDGPGRVEQPYKPANPQSMTPEQMQRYRETGMVPDQLGPQAGKPQAPQGEGPKPAATSEPYSREDLESMTVDDLRQHAEDYEIDLKGATRKAEIVEAILKEQK